MKISIFLLLPVLMFAEDFISHYEYGQMLYSNPRGVSCKKCHGPRGKGRIIAYYKDENGYIQKLLAPDISDISLEYMLNALNIKHKIMPQYYLTTEEVKAIYDFLYSINKTSSIE